MKDYNKIITAAEQEQLAVVEKVRNLLFDLLEAYGIPQREVVYTGIKNILDQPKHGYKFVCNTNGTAFLFTVLVKDNFIETMGFTAGPLPATKIVKRWYSLKTLEKGFIKIFGPCFNKGS